MCYLLNRLPHLGIQDAIIYERWFDFPLETLKHLRALGVNCNYLHHPPRGKLTELGRPGILVGYESDGRGRNTIYRVYNPELRKVRLSGDVVVHDERPPATAEHSTDAGAMSAPVGSGDRGPGAIPSRHLTPAMFLTAAPPPPPAAPPVSLTVTPAQQGGVPSVARVAAPAVEPHGVEPRALEPRVVVTPALINRRSGRTNL